MLLFDEGLEPIGYVLIKLAHHCLPDPKISAIRSQMPTCQANPASSSSAISCHPSDPAENIEAILLDPAEAPIDTEIEILWLENIEALLRENTAAVRSGLGSQAAARIGPTVAEHQPAPTNANLAAD